MFKLDVDPKISKLKSPIQHNHTQCRSNPINRGQNLNNLSSGGGYAGPIK